MKRKESGFTLIELMIVVAIIGILAVIAIPNFLKFQCKSKQSEAKTNLSGLFTANKSFFGENNAYTTDLVSVNWFPDGSPLYVYGYTQNTETNSNLANLIVGYDNTRADTQNVAVQIDASGNQRYSTLKMVNTQGGAVNLDVLACASVGTTAANGQCTLSSVSPEYGFIAGASGDIDTDGGVAVGDWDHWNINAQRVQTNTQNDCSD